MGKISLSPIATGPFLSIQRNIYFQKMNIRVHIPEVTWYYGQETYIEMRIYCFHNVLLYTFTSWLHILNHKADTSTDFSVTEN